MVEGFDFKDDLARWAVIAKVPFRYLGDKQVEARLAAEPDWYAMQAVISVIQACGRIVRNGGDWGTVYVLDQDFGRLIDKHRQMFPKWFLDAVQR
jgi:Rad3-related DNA helicase